ncbi:GNAT family N-acetyltransferase [Salinimicrobium tongyeongense]|uniref:GNAT family N-acetyltransferase n=1 Tax=Salinimicrobium tongyeongense TaxID=2809707 RepID=A0ABY6NSP9_9FLAO|nr:GNAT family N-acetyltransferase [Salinimicrobium tongyeongense]UZH55513.1 GNAT family N-acetyltransferase [Salinimicrobium tongyeongense]
MIEFSKDFPEDLAFDAIFNFLSRVPFGRYMNDPFTKKEEAVRGKIEKLKLYGQTGVLYFAFKDEDIIGLIGFKKSEWDTDHFGYAVAKIDYFLVSEEQEDRKNVSLGLINLFESWARDEKISLVMTKIDTSYFTPVLTLQEKNFFFYECITQRIVHSENFTDKDLSSNYRYMVADDVPVLKSIALQSTFDKSHFYLDNRIKKNKVDSLYQKWIESAVNTESRIIVVEEENKIAGMFIFKINGYDKVIAKKRATWEFAAVSPEFRGKGIGREIFKCALHACIDNGAEVIDTTLIEKNIISQKIHEELGFKLLNTYYTFHKWF